MFYKIPTKYFIAFQQTFYGISTIINFNEIPTSNLWNLSIKHFIIFQWKFNIISLDYLI